MIAEIYDEAIPKNFIYQYYTSYKKVSHYKYVTFVNSNKYSVSLFMTSIIKFTQYLRTMILNLNLLAITPLVLNMYAYQFCQI